MVAREGDGGILIVVDNVGTIGVVVPAFGG